MTTTTIQDNSVNDMEDLDGHVEEGGDVEDPLLLLLLQVVQDDAGHPHLVQQPRVDVPKIEAAMQQANTLEGEKDNNERGRPVQWSKPVSAPLPPILHPWICPVHPDQQFEEIQTV